jgi:sulfoxide reductase heme-binding subunit YedZ
MNGSTAFWYASRATGIVALLLLTAVFVLGILVNRQGRLPGLPRFAVTSLHRNLSLLSVVFIAVHVLTAVLDTYVSIPVTAGVIPFASGYERFWLGLGAISLDLMIAMIVTSLVRGHLNRLLWRAIHLLAYLSWPVAFAHSIGSSKDLQHGWLLYLAIICAAVVVAATAWRLAHAARQVPRAARVAAVFAQHAAAGSRTAGSRTAGSRTAGSRATRSRAEGNSKARRTRETV